VPAALSFSGDAVSTHRHSRQPERRSSGIIEGMSSVEHLAQTAYEAHRGAVPAQLPPWNESSEEEQQAWKAAVTAVAGQTGVTLTDAEAVPAASLQVQVGEDRHTFGTEFTAGRQGALVIDDDYASNHHARFQLAHGLWYVRDLGSTNGTWLNGRRIHAAQRVKKGDKIRIGHTVVTVVS
jgi:pSer/pThr/pTyr-binding forkhead associated (FHA) protein